MIGQRCSKWELLKSTKILQVDWTQQVAHILIERQDPTWSHQHQTQKRQKMLRDANHFAPEWKAWSDHAPVQRPQMIQIVESINLYVHGIVTSMLNQMHKYVNHLSRKKIFAVEKDEHNLKNTPTEKQLLSMEKREHKLKSTPTMSQLLKIEKKEHGNKKAPRF